MKSYVFSILMLLSLGLSACTPFVQPTQVTLAFCYSSLNYDSSKETGFFFEADPDFPHLIETFTFDRGHIIDQSDYEAVYSAVSDFIPHNEGGYYVLIGYYSSMQEPSTNGMFKQGYECLTDTTFYYSFEGGQALQRF